VNPIILAVVFVLFAVAVTLYYFAVSVQAAAHVPQEPSVLCATTGARNLTAVNRTAGYCVFNGTHIIYLSPIR
jgi:acetoin utilization deacetylase AcuC-like enzyme